MALPCVENLAVPRPRDGIRALHGHVGAENGHPTGLIAGAETGKIQSQGDEQYAYARRLSIALQLEPAWSERLGECRGQPVFRIFPGVVSGLPFAIKVIERGGGLGAEVAADPESNIKQRVLAIPLVSEGAFLKTGI